jgi:prepilin-type N-terminal cleavage/methylation domain-containing protein
MAQHYSGNKGFTLIELAIVIALLSILASLAIQKMADLQSSAERATAQDFLSSLNSGLGLYNARMLKNPPGGFSNFVSSDPAHMTQAPAGDNFYTVITATMGPNAKNGQQCTVSNTQVDCTAAFNRINVSYSFTNDVVTASITER